MRGKYLILKLKKTTAFTAKLYMKSLALTSRKPWQIHSDQAIPGLVFLVGRLQ